MWLKGRISSRVLGFVILAAVLATANTYGSTLAAALFLNRAGAEAIPLYYVFYAGLSIPVSIAFSRIIDRWPRPTLFTALLIGGAVVTALAAPAARSQSTPPFYLLYVVISVFEQLSYSIFYVLLTDYFTSVETNRSTTALAIGMALGGVAGGALAGVGAAGFSSADLLFGMPALLVLTLGLFLLLRRKVAALGEAEPQAEEGLWESLTAIKPLIARHPIIALLAAGVFTNIVVQSLIEYQVFVIYTRHYPQESALTSFLGVLNGVLNLVNIVTNAVITGPLLTRLGVARMNLVYPAMTVSAFVALGASFSLPSAIFGHIVYDPWAHSVDAPVFVSNYNAMPLRFVGRARVFNDGLMYPLAMALTGAVLWLIQDRVSQGIVTLCGFGAALLFLACGLGIRRAYARGLMEMLRSGSVDLDANVGAVPQISVMEVRRLLQSDDPKDQSLGLDLAARGDSQAFRREIELLLARAEGPVRRVFVRRFSGNLSQDLVGTIVDLLEADDAAVRATALETLVGSGHAVGADMLERLVRDPAPEVAGVAAIEARRRGIASPAIDAALERILTGPDARRLRALRVIQRCADPDLVPLLADLRKDASEKVLTRVIEVAATLGPTAPSVTIEWARAALTESFAAAGGLRSAAYRLLAARQDPAAIPLLDVGLGDPLKEVRMACATGLAAFGEAVMPVVRRNLASGSDVREDAAIEIAGQIGGPAVDDLLYRHLAETHFTAVRRNAKWLEMLPPPVDLRAVLLAPFAATLVDANRRALDVALAILGALGYRRTLSAMHGILAGGDVRSRANAIETIASIGHRRFVQPFLPMLEVGIDAVVRRGTGSLPGLQEMLTVASGDTNRWIRAAAVLAIPQEHLPPSLLQDADPIVQDAVAFVRGRGVIAESILNRLIFLKTVPLFDGLSLDDLLSVDNALGEQEYPAGAAIVRQGEPGSTLFILARGTAAVRVGAGEGKEVARLAQGEFFGEMSLFDREPRSASVIAATDATLLTLERDRFAILIRQRPEVLWRMCRMFGSRLREANRRLLAA